MKPLRAALLSIPLVAGASLVAHGLAYRLALPDAHTREQALAESGHGYLRFSSSFFALCVALVLACAIVHALRAARGQAHRPVPIWPFLLLPFALFTVQEHTERFVKTGVFPVDAVLARTFLLGLVLQVPVALIAYAIARVVVAVAREVGRRLAGAPRRSRLRPDVFRGRPSVVEVTRIPVLALRCAGRAPPSRSFAS